MYRIIKMNNDFSTEDLDIVDDVSALDKIRGAKLSNSNKLLVNCTGDWPDNPEDISKIVENIEKFSDVEVLRVVVGADFDSMTKTSPAHFCGCPPRCFCVHQGGRCWCEIYIGQVIYRCEGRC